MDDKGMRIWRGVQSHSRIRVLKSEGYRKTNRPNVVWSRDKATRGKLRGETHAASQRSSVLFLSAAVCVSAQQLGRGYMWNKIILK